MIHRTLTAVVLAFALAQAGQNVGVLRVKVTVADADHRVRPVPRHALLISDNPSTAAPRRVVTSAYGTAELRLRPGNYTVESDEPLVFQGKRYEWRQTIDLKPGGETVLELTGANAEPDAGGVPSAAGELSPSALLMEWQDIVVTIWTPTARGAAFLIDPRGLLLTNQRIVGAATSVEVQLTPTKKVAARVLVASRERNVAVLWVAPDVAKSLKPATLGYSEGTRPSVIEGDAVVAIAAIAFEQKTLASGNVTRVAAHAFSSDLRIDSHSTGAPVLNQSGETVGIITPDDSGGRTHAVPIDDARAVIAEAEKKVGEATPPSATTLPVEPQGVFPQDALAAAMKRRESGANGYELRGADFDVTFITPPILYAAQHLPERTTGARTAGGRQDIMEAENARRSLQDFANWSEYVSDNPPVLMIRATPKLVEGFWTTVGRVAASTQGVSIPPIKHMKSSFARMRLFCGETEITPIHPFTIERQVDDTTSVSEGLYVYELGAIGPQCAKVTMALFSQKEPDKADTRAVDAKVLERVAADAAPYFARK